MQIVIELEDLVYEQIKTHGNVSEFHELINSGTPLPKGHGRLIDENNLWFEDIDDISCVTQRNIENAPTIIEADKAESEG